MSNLFAADLGTLPNVMEAARLRSAAPLPTPRRIRLSRKKGWRLPPNTKSVARPGPWGNDFKIGKTIVRRNMTPGGGELSVFVTDAAHAVRLYRRFLPLETRIAARIDLAGKNLACWCRLCPAHEHGKPMGEACPDCAPCHADVLLDLANRHPIPGPRSSDA